MADSTIGHRRLRKAHIICATLIFGLIGAGNALAQSTAEFALGGHNLCAIDTQGQLQCTTEFERDTYLPPEDGTLYSKVASGSAHSCALTRDGDIRCWGLNNFGQLDAPSSAIGFAAISAGEGHSCAIDNNMQAVCWGLNTNGQTDVPADNNDFVQIYAAGNGSCAIKSTGITVCWSTDNRFNVAPSNSGYTDLVIGGGGTGTPSCGLDGDGAIDCWFSTAIAPPNANAYIDIAANGTVFCGLTSTGALDCNYRSLGSASFEMTLLALQDEINQLPPLTSIEMSTQSFPRNSVCGIGTDGQVYCAGLRDAQSIPGRQQAVLPTPMNLSFVAYSDTDGELLWERIRSPESQLISGYNIYKDDVLLEFTRNNSSYYDSNLLVDEEYTYSIAAVSLDAVEGPRSASIVVSTGDRDQPDGNPNDLPVVTDSQPTNIDVSRYAHDALEIFWDEPSGYFNPRYQIYRNGEFIRTVPGPSYFDSTVNADSIYHYTIVVVSRTDEQIGVGFVNVDSLNTQ